MRQPPIASLAQKLVYAAKCLEAEGRFIEADVMDRTLSRLAQYNSGFVEEPISNRMYEWRDVQEQFDDVAKKQNEFVQDKIPEYAQQTTGDEGEDRGLFNLAGDPSGGVTGPAMVVDDPQSGMYEDDYLSSNLEKRPYPMLPK